MSETVNTRNLNEAASKAIQDSNSANLTTADNISSIVSIIKEISAEKDTALKLPKDVKAIEFDVYQAKNEREFFFVLTHIYHKNLVLFS